MKKAILIITAILFILSFPFTAHAQITKEGDCVQSALEGNQLEFYDERYDSFSNDPTTAAPKPTQEPMTVAVKPAATTLKPPPDNIPGSPNWIGWFFIAIAVILSIRIISAIKSRKKK